jgi:hypothetical protein
MSSTFLSNIQRFGPSSHNNKISLTAGTGTCSVSFKTYSGADFQADSPLLLRFEDLSEQDHYAAIVNLVIDAGDTFGLPSDISEPGLPLYVGYVLNGSTPEPCISLVDYQGNVATTTTAATNLSVLSSGSYSGKALWLAHIVGFKRIAGVWDFASAEVVYGGC